MALINCPECGKQYSDTADACVHCGYKTIIKKGNEAGDGCYFGVFMAMFLAYFMFDGCLAAVKNSGKKTSFTAAKSAPYVHKMPFITEGLNSVWVFTECYVYQNPEEKDPVGFIKQKASVVVQSVPVKGEYDWVKIVEAPVRPMFGCKMALDGDYIKNVKGLYMKRINLITRSPDAWPD